MYNVLIVEDETIFREYLKTVLIWQDFQLTITGEARNGAAALEFIKTNEVHIALVDISMPVMDGITFAAAALKHNPELYIILITGHSEFEYAKSALQLGIKDYILKPFDHRELAQALGNAVAFLTKQQQSRKQDLIRDQAVNDELANALISDSFMTMTNEVQAMLEKAAGGRPINSYRLAAIEEDFFDQQWVSSGQKYLWKKTVINILKGLLADKYRHLTFCGRSGNVLTVFLFRDSWEAAGYQGQELERLCRTVRAKLGFSVTCALSAPVEEYGRLPLAYDQVMRILLHKLRLGYGGLLTGQDMERQTAIRHYPRIPVDKLVVAMKNGQVAEAKAYLNSIFDEMKERGMNMEITGVVFMELVSICLSYLTERGFDIVQILGQDFMPYSQLHLLRSEEAIREQLLTIYGKAISACTGNQFTKANKIAVKAREFIENNYSDPNLSVEGVARNLYINPSYLRAVFKKEYGHSVLSYIIEKRMEKARELILTNRFKLTTVSQMVGFSDAAYFSKCFKKYYGLSPSAFENMQKIPKIPPP